MKRTLLIATVVAFSAMMLAANIGAEASAKCTGAKNCKACKNCKYCKHCAKDGKSCGVCK